MSSLNATPAGERVHIGLFGKRNAGKSSLINALTGQKLAVVADVPGTTTDPVLKAMELLPLGPVLMMDTAGIDDAGELGQLRVQKSLQVLNKTDIAILVIDSTTGITDEDLKLLQRIEDKELSCIVVFTKADAVDPKAATVSKRDAAKGPAHNGAASYKQPATKQNVIPSTVPQISVSSTTGQNIRELKELLAHLVPQKKAPFPICADLIRPEDTVLLVTPIDSAAPKGRLILPQQQTIRDIIDRDAVAVITKENNVRNALENMKKPPVMVITDSQAFGKVNQAVPEEIKLTSFSILMARHKGNLKQAVLGVAALKQLQEGDNVLISEGCTHHRQCGDIGTEKLPKWIQDFTGKQFHFSWTSGTEFPADLSMYKLIIHCGGCMLNEREMQYRYRCAADQNVPMTNYGLCIAYTHGILKRSLSVFPDLAEKL
ncbi:MAG TPA: [FeFe] hydrogenase H-cluster maturation GTPase HydF [Acidaminococcaceae bacterium]|nr:[FeFe] hydrogenase H-cluster maturation GTPase HydF [Acidaminococcaceae bacterium]